MSAQFPTNVVTVTQLPTSIVDSTPTNSPDHAGQHVQLNYEVIAVETALGTNPQGSYATVKAALSTQGTLITSAQATATAALSTASSAFTIATAAQTTANTAITTANTAVTLATAAQTTANARATYPGAGVPLSTGSAWSTSYSVGTAANNLVQLNGSSQIPAVNGSLLTNLTGSQITSLFGAWVSKSTNTSYQALTDGLFIVTWSTGNSTSGNASLYSDSNNPPTTVRAEVTRETGGIATSATIPVRKNDYYKCDTGPDIAFFIGIGS